MTAGDFITEALIAAGILALGETARAEESNYALSKLNGLLDSMNAQRQCIYDVGFLTYTLTANHQPHTIGLAADVPDFVVTGNRPTRIESASLVLTTVTPNLDVPLNIRDDDWWANVRVKSLTNALPSDLYYSPGMPLGSIYLWPIDNTAHDIRLELWTSLSQVTLTTTLKYPPGYKEAIVLTLAELLCIGVKSPDAWLAGAAQKARGIIAAANCPTPKISTMDGGMPGSEQTGRSSTYNWMTGDFGR